MSLADVQFRLVPRRTLSSDDAMRLAECLPLLRRRYNEQLQRAKIQFVDPRFKLSSCRPLLLSARATASVSQLIYEALTRADSPASAPHPLTITSEAIEEALSWNECQLDRIGQQLQSLDFADTHCAWLKILLDQLESSSRVSSSDWTRLARDVISSTALRRESDGGPLLPGVPLRSYFAEIGHARHAEAVAHGVDAANLAIRLAERRSFGRCDPELLAVAALSHDCGLLLCRKATETQLRPVHASISAGLVGGIVDYSTELPSLVAQHHRRLNEPPLVSGSYVRRQNRDSRLLAVVARWLELTEGSNSIASETPPAAARLVFAEPAGRLVRETLRGDWDRQFVGELLAMFGFRAESEALRQTERGVAASPTGDHKRRLDSADTRGPQPNLPLADLDPTNLELAPRSREIDHARAVAK
jgi:hypothetical protein